MEENLDFGAYGGTVSYITNLTLRRLGDHVKIYDMKRALSTKQVHPLFLKEELDMIHEVLIPFIGNHGGIKLLSKLKKIDEQHEYDLANVKMVEVIILCLINYRSDQIQYLPKFLHRNIGGIKTYTQSGDSPKVSFVDSYNCLEEIISIFMGIRYFLDIEKNRLDEIRSRNNQSEEAEIEIRTFRSNMSDRTLHKLYNQLTNDRFISKASTIEAFFKVFQNRLISELDSPVIWTGGVRSLAYFFKVLLVNGIIDSSTWKAKIERGGLFCDEDGKVPSASHLANESAKNAIAPASKELLDAIIDDIDIDV